MNETKDLKQTKSDKEKALGSEKISSLLLRLAVPAIAAQIINVLYNIVDRMYIGHIPGEGANALTGIGVTLPAIVLISAFAALIGYGGSPRASICMGRKEHDKAEEILGNCVAAIAVLSVVLTAVFQIFGGRILLLFGASEQTLPYAAAYMRIYTWGTVFVQFTLGLNSFISAQGFTNISMKTTLIGAALNIILDPVFIFGFDMGVRGAAFATVFSQAVSCVWVLVFLSGKKTLLRIRRKNIGLKREVILPVLALGVSPFIMQSTESVLQICFNTSLLKYGGNLAVGAMTILTSVMQFSMMPLNGVTQGMQPIVSYNYGAGNVERVKQTFKLTLTSCLTYSMLMWAVSMLFPELLAGIFTGEEELISYTARALRVYMAAAGIFGAQIACQQTFLALGNAKVSVFLAILRKIILLIPLVYILPIFFADKAFAVFLAEPVADTIAVMTTVSMFYVTFKKTIRKMKEEKQLD